MEKAYVVLVESRGRNLGHCRRRRRSMLNNMLLRRWISRSRALGIFRSPSHYNSAGSFRSLNSACSRESATFSNKPRPRLMLPPVLDGGAGAEIVGCSHGWVAVFNKRNNDLCLSDPFSHRNIKLPPIHTLPDPDFNLDLDGYGSVSKVILSSSPDDNDCRAMMTFGPANRLAFCLPGRSSEWTPIGKHFFDLDHRYPLESVARVHEDLVYCTRRKVFTSITAGHLDLRNFSFRDFFHDLERCDWDIEDPDSPELVGLELVFGENIKENRWLDENIELLENECIQIPHLVYAEESDQLFVVVQFVRLMSSDGYSPLGFVPRCEVKGLSGVFPGKTYGFMVLGMNDEDVNDCSREREFNYQRVCTVVEDLNGMSMFIGINHSFAISASDEFKPNSIYFSDAKRITRVCGGDDTGVFDYATKTISPVSHDAPTQSFKAPPFWFS